MPSMGRYLQAAAAALLLAAPGMALPAPQGTAFTYQGLLRQDGMPFNGSADIVFDLFDAELGGGQIGPSLTFTAANGNPLVVQAGVFNATLDFGPATFNVPISEQRFLRITINGNPVSPRTPVQNAPYALQSRSSELAYTVSDGAIGALQIDASTVQRRVFGTCSVGSSIRAVDVDGAVICQTDADSGGTITGIIAGSGLSGGGNAGSVSLGLANPLTLSGSAALGVVQANNTGGGHAVRGTSSAGTAVFGLGAIGVQGESSALGGRGLVGYASATSTETVGVYGQSDSPTGRGIGGYSPAGTGVYALSASGFGMQAVSGSGTGLLALGSDAAIPTTTADFGVLASTKDPAGAGVQGVAESANGIGVLGTSAGSGSTGVRGHVSGSSGIGVAGMGAIGLRGETTVSSTAGAGVRGISTAPVPPGSEFNRAVWGSTNTGAGVFGEVLTNVEGAGVVGYGAGGSTAGVRGYNSNGVAVSGLSNFGTAMYASSDNSIGLQSHTVNGITAIYTSSSAANGRTVHAISSGSNGAAIFGISAGTNGFGVQGLHNLGGSSVNWGVYGQTTSTGGYGIEGYNPNGIGVRGNGGVLAGQFIGNVQVLGTLAKSAGSFQIDHPLDPANKYLYHSFVESPDMKNIYDGVATLDARGEAWVEMPAYFEALNKEFRYQLTALDAPAPSLHVKQRIEGNRFMLAGGAPWQQVSWQVTGTRRDAYAEAHRIEAEVDKPKGERGKYLHPGLFGESGALSAVPATKLLDASSSPAGDDRESRANR
jgi:hypothetical protein